MRVVSVAPYFDRMNPWNVRATIVVASDEQVGSLDSDLARSSIKRDQGGVDEGRANRHLVVKVARHGRDCER